MRRKTNLFVVLLLWVCTVTLAQMPAYRYKRPLKGITATWHTLILPDAVYGKIAPDLNDVRIFGITENKDTIEAPYIWKTNGAAVTDKSVNATILNASHNEKGYYFTFAPDASAPLNRIDLSFNQPNFDWRINLEGSNEQKEWFTLLSDYRILSLQNKETRFAYTTLEFPAAQYRYFRIRLNTKEQPVLSSVRISTGSATPVLLQNYPVHKITKTENREDKQTTCYIELQMPLPVSGISLKVKDSIDYYRPVSVMYVSDSFSTAQGVAYNYRTLLNGTLHSISNNPLTFRSTIVQKLKVVISNQDNQPLDFDSIQVQGFGYEMAARFTEKATYYLVYGNKKAALPQYDLNRFADKIPVALTPLETGQEMQMESMANNPKGPLFKNKAWLWALMIAVVILLGWFSAGMIRKAG